MANRRDLAGSARTAGISKPQYGLPLLAPRAGGTVA